MKPPAGDIKRTTVSVLAGKGGKITLGKDLLAGLIKSRTRVNVSVGPAAALDVPGLLTSLDRYPYGCAEQTVSRAPIAMFVARMSSFSSSSAGASASVPPVRMSSVVMPARPTLSAGSR